MKRRDEEPKLHPVVVPIRRDEEEEDVEDFAAQYRDEYDAAVTDAERTLAAALVRRAEAYGHRDRDVARVELERAMALDPRSGAAWYQLAIIEYGDAALDAINEALARDKTNAYYYGTRGGIHEERGELDRALIDYDRAVHLDRGRDSIWVAYRARVHDKLGHWDEAWRDFTTAFRMAPRFTHLLHERAAVLVHKGDFDEALRELDRAIAAHPDLVVCVREKALVYFRLGAWGDALREIDRVLAALAGDRDCRDGYDHYIRGAILVVRGDALGALVAFDRALAMEPRHGQFAIRRAQCLLALGRVRHALAACNLAIRDAPHCEGFRLWRARALERIGDRESLRCALADIRIAIERAPADARYRAEKARILARQGQRARAAVEARAALELLRKEQPLPRAYHALLESFEARGLDLGHAPPVPEDELRGIVRNISPPPDRPQHLRDHVPK